MQRWIEHAARVTALLAALLAAAAGAWRAIPPLPLALRTLLAGAAVYVFVRFAGELLGRSVLRGLAEDQIKRQEAPQSDSAPGKEAPEERKAA